MATRELVKDGVVVNAIEIDDHCIVITQEEADAMELEWFREWDFYIVADGMTVVRVDNGG